MYARKKIFTYVCTKVCLYVCTYVLIHVYIHFSEDKRAKGELVDDFLVYSIMEQLLSALEYMQEREIIHRDLKPGIHTQRQINTHILHKHARTNKRAHMNVCTPIYSTKYALT